MARGHRKVGVAGAHGHEGGAEGPEYRVRGRRAGGKLHPRRNKSGGAEPESGIVSRALVVHMDRQETELEARIEEALQGANEAVAAIIAARAAREAVLAAIPVERFTGDAGIRQRLIDQGIIH